MNRDFNFILEEATARLERGETVEDCLARYPKYAGRLEPLLRMAAFSIRALAYAEPPSEAALGAGKQRLLSVAAQKKSGSQPRGLPALFPTPLKRLASIALMTLILIAVVGGLSVASARSLPGDLLYPVKLAKEKSQLFLTFDPHTRDQRLADFAQERRAEVHALLGTGRKVPVKFEGTLDSFDDRVWTITGLEVTLDADTRMDGHPVVGNTVAVEGLTLGNGTILAQHLTMKGPGRMPGSTIVPSPTTTLNLTGTPQQTITITGTSTPTMTLTGTSTPTTTCCLQETPTPYPTATDKVEESSTQCPTEPDEPDHDCMDHTKKTPHH